MHKNSYRQSSHGGHSHLGDTTYFVPLPPELLDQANIYRVNKTSILVYVIIDICCCCCRWRLLCTVKWQVWLIIVVSTMWEIVDLRNFLSNLWSVFGYSQNVSFVFISFGFLEIVLQGLRFSSRVLVSVSLRMLDTFHCISVNVT